MNAMTRVTLSEFRQERRTLRRLADAGHLAADELAAYGAAAAKVGSAEALDALFLEKRRYWPVDQLALVYEITKE
jgi:hypothetical protein